MRHRLSYSAYFLILGLALMTGVQVHASDFRLGFSLGYGGSGLTKNMSVTANFEKMDVIANRDEGPGAFSLFADMPINDFFLASVEHFRGFRLGPVSSGVSMTGFVGRWYFLEPLPSYPMISESESRVFIKSFVPFVGATIGIGMGTIVRSGDLITDLDGSGLYVGWRMGADYPVMPGIGVRPEIFYSSTIFSDAKVTGFAVQCAVYFYL